MNKIRLIVILLSISLCLNAQIDYGSNNGSYVTIRGTKIYYEEYGQGTPLLLLHGGLGTMADFKKCIPALSEKYHVILPDSPGNGRSESADSILSYRLLADYYSKFIDLLKLDSVYVMGWSDGGIAALLMTVNRPDKVRMVVASGANYRFDGMTKKNMDFYKNTYSLEWANAKHKDWYDEYMRLSPQGNWERHITEPHNMWIEEEYFPLSCLGKINIPVLIVSGDNDMFTLDHELELYRALKKGQFCVLPGTSHRVFSERPDLIVTIATDFFENSH